MPPRSMVPTGPPTLTRPTVTLPRVLSSNHQLAVRTCEGAVASDETGTAAIWAVLVNRAGPGAARPFGHELEASRYVRADLGRAREHEARGLVVIVQTGVRAGVDRRRSSTGSTVSPDQRRSATCAGCPCAPWWLQVPPHALPGLRSNRHQGRLPWRTASPRHPQTNQQQRTVPLCWLTSTVPRSYELLRWTNATGIQALLTEFTVIDFPAGGW